MTEAYLTIDDSPSAHTDDLVDFLAARGIPALLFCRGDRLEQNPEPIIRAIEKGFLIGNHTYAHMRASERGLAETKEDILKCEALIEAAYKAAGRARTHKTFRFSYLDRGAGAWVIDFDALDPAMRKAMEPVFWEGLNFCDLKKPPAEQFENMAALQDFLAGEGFSAPFEGVTLDWYARSDIARARDCFFTFSSSDWMLTARHLAKNWPCKSVEDLKRRVDRDPYLHDPASRHVVLIHDQDEIFGPVCDLVDYFQDRGFKFLDF